MQFYAAYNPEGRLSFASTRREWRALDLLAPSLHLHPNSNVLPLSVKPDQRVTAERIMAIFRDTFEGTDFDPVKNLTVADEQGKTRQEPAGQSVHAVRNEPAAEDQRRLELAR